MVVNKMKANNGKSNNILRDMWETPQELWDKLDKQYSFKFDCCADTKNTKTKAFAKDFLQHNLKTTGRVCWMNPPFSVAWKMFEHFFGNVERGVAIYKCDNLETGLWQKVILPNASWLFIPNNRISYDGLDGGGVRFPSALIGFNVPKPKNLKGTVLFIGRDKIDG